MMKYLKFLPYNRFNICVRDKREVDAVLELGHEVLVVAADKKIDENSGFDACEFMNDGCDIPAGQSRLKRYVTMLKDRLRLIKKLSKIDFDAISCHDLFALRIGYFIIKKHKDGKKIRLIYDSHEFEVGRNAKRSRLITWCVRQEECFLARRCDMIIIPSDSAADELQRIHRLKKRPVVIKSVPPKWNITEADAEEARSSVRALLGIDRNAFVILYHGNVFPNRGIEQMLAALPELPGVTGLIVGNPNNTAYLNSLKAYASKLGIADRLIYHESVPYKELWRYISAADAGMVIVPATCKSHYFMMPNKFFENIHALNPVICSDFPDVRRIVQSYKIGLLVNPTDITDICNAVRKMKDDIPLYKLFKSNLCRAKEELNWNTEKEFLKKQINIIMREEKL